MDDGASLRDRAGGPTDLSRSTASQPEALIPSANDQPDWFEIAKGLAHAIMFNRATRAEHVVGRDGRVRMGMVDLLACYAIDDAAREFFDLAGLPVAEVEAPNEHQAMFMAVTGRKWHHWFTERDAIVQGAGLGPGRGKVDLDRLVLASGIEARSDATPQSGAAVGESPSDAQNTPQSGDTPCT
jgi:hypothetical protein